MVCLGIDLIEHRGKWIYLNIVVETRHSWQNNFCVSVASLLTDLDSFLDCLSPSDTHGSIMRIGKLKVEVM